MFRMWFMTFTGKPRDQHVYEHAHESPWLMTVPLILLAILSVCVAWGKEQFPGVHRFLLHKWYFDELYSAVIVRPGLIVAGWCRNFDLKLIDGFVHFLARAGLWTSRLSGKTDRGVVDGFVNVLADVFYGTGSWLRNLQTGYIRSYILFLALAAMGIWVLLYAWANAPGRRSEGAEGAGH